MLDVVNAHLTREGFNTCTIRGDVPVKQRAQTVDSFNNDSRGPSVSQLLQLLLVIVVITLGIYTTKGNKNKNNNNNN